MGPLGDGPGSWNDSLLPLNSCFAPSLFHPKTQNWLISRSGVDLIWCLQIPLFSGLVTILDYVSNA